MTKGGDEAVWFSAICAAFAFMAAKSYPSPAMSMIFIVMISWTIWSLYKMLLHRL